MITFSVVRWYDGGAEGRRTLHDKFKTPRDAEAAAQLWRDHPRDWVAVDALRHGVDVPHRAHNAEAISRYEAMRRFAIKADKGDERAAMALDGLLKLDDWREASERAKGGDARS